MKHGSVCPTGLKIMPGAPRAIGGAVTVMGHGGRSGCQHTTASITAGSGALEESPEPRGGLAQETEKKVCLRATRACAGDKETQEAKEAYNSEHGVLAREAKLWKLLGPYCALLEKINVHNIRMNINHRFLCIIFICKVLLKCFAYKYNHCNNL